MINWGRPTDYRKHGVAHLRSVTAAVDSDTLGDTLNVPGPYFRIFWAKVGPGGFIIPHIDAAPFRDRWHIPVEPNGWFWQNNTFTMPARGEPFQVRHWLPHAVYNPTEHDRIHLIVDRDETPEDAPEVQSLTLTEMIPEIQQMIDAL